MRVHLSLNSTDLTAATTFYSALFGEGPDKVRDDYLRFQPAGVPITLAVMPGTPTPGGTLSHLGIKFLTADKAKQAWQRVEAAGLSTTKEEQVSCCHAVQDKAWVTDPDGNAWEIYAVTDELMVQATPRNDGCCTTDQPASCC